MKQYFDTSVLVAFCVKGHSHHAPALAALRGLVKSRHQGFVSAHGLAELYSVLTRAPFTPPVYPGEAIQILEQSILPNLDLVDLSGKEYVALHRDCAERGWTGGRVSDLLHVRSAEKKRCERIYTFKMKDFRELASEDFRPRVTSP